MRNLSTLVLLVIALTLGLSVAPPSHAEPADDAGPGIAILASSVGGDQKVEDILAFVKEARVRDVVIDWAWITLHWDNTKFDQVNTLVEKLKAEKVGVAAMYRPRCKAFQLDTYKVKFQVGADGKHPDGCEILYADAAARKWGTQWAVDILTKCPAFDEVVIYNPSQSDQSADSVAARKADAEYDNKSVHAFLSETREAMRKVKKEARIGLVRPPSEAMFKPFRDVVDVERPYIFVLKDADYKADMDAALEIMKATKTPGPALAKITWGADDKVSDEWLAKFIATAREKKLRYCFWTWDTAFMEGTYDLDSLCNAAGLDVAKIKPLIRNLGGKSGLKADPAEVQKAVDDAMAKGGADGYPAVRDVATKYGEDAIDALSKILDDTKRPVFDRWRAAGGLGVIGSGKALECLLRNSKDKEDMVRWLCAEALGLCGKGSAEAKARLKEMAENDPAVAPGADGKDDYYVRTTAKQALARLSQRGPDEWEPFFTEMPWAETLEDALEQSKKDGKLTFVFINPYDNSVFDKGYREAAAYVEKQRSYSQTPPTTDVGFVKERAMLVGLLCEPRAAAFIKQRCVPVKMRLNIMHWTDTYKDEPDALKSIGLRAKDVGAPCVLVLSPEGKLVAHARDLTIYAPEIFWKIATTALAGCKLEPPESLKEAEKLHADNPTDESYLALLEAQLDAGEFKAFRELASSPPKGAADRSGLLVAETDLLEDRPQAALDRLKPLPVGKGERFGYMRVALLIEALLRLGLPDDAVGLFQTVHWKPVAFDEAVCRLYFMDALLADQIIGQDFETMEFLSGKGGNAWCVRASLFATTGGPNPHEWCRYSDLELPNVFVSTETGKNAKTGTTSGDLNASIVRAAEYLMDRQRTDGAWEGPVSAMQSASGLSQVDFGTVPRTALAVCALHQAKPLLDKALAKRADAAIELGAAYVRAWNENPQPSIFSVTYALYMELTLFDELKFRKKKGGRERVLKLVDVLRGMETDGGYTYASDPARQHTFNTATVMLDLVLVKELKLAEVDEMLERGAKFLESQRVGKLANFHYGSAMQHLTSEEEPQGGSMRAPLCTLALIRGGAKDERKEHLPESIELFFKHIDDVRRTTKRWESFFEPDAMHDAYHYYFGAWYGAQAINELADKEAAKKHRLALADKLLATQEIDGGFCDAQISCGRNAGTAMALMALVNCAAE